VPAFAWSAAARATVLTRATSSRSSASLRVCVERLWFTSGVDEGLAGLIRPSAGAARVTDFVSRWGGDPAVTGGGSLPAEWPGAADSTNAAGSVSGVRMAEDSSRQVDIVHYEVGREAADGSLIGWDAERDQWYVDRDVDIDDAYRPLLRLALARNQAGAPRELRLSPVAPIAPT